MSNITKLRSKIVDIEAMQFTGGRENASEVVAWVIANGGFAIWWPLRTHDTSEDAHGREVTTKRTNPLPEHIEVNTLDSKGRVFVGDWMFRGLKGEFYPCQNDTKVAKYDEITGEEQRPGHPHPFDDAATAWTYGERAGESYVRRAWSDEPNAPHPVNPYIDDNIISTEEPTA